MKLQSVGAILAGLVFTVVASTVIDALLHYYGFYGPLTQAIDDRQAAVATVYRGAAAVAGAWLSARLAPLHPMGHALFLGCFGAVLGAAGVVQTWNAGLGPHWYSIALAVLAIPQCWLGGKIYMMRPAENVG